MRTKAIPALMLAVLAGCDMIQRPVYIEPEPLPVEAPVPPPERFLRVPANFRFRDDASRKEYLLRMYKDERFEDNVVTVIEEGAIGERLADDEEFAFAMETFVRTWVEAGQEDQVSYLRQSIVHEREVRATLLDDMIRHKRATLRDLEDQLFDLKADLMTTRKTGYRAPPEQAGFLQDRMGRIETLRITELAELRILEGRRRLRDGSPELDELEDLLAE